MKILITGGLGRIGLATVTECLRKGHEVRLIDAVAPEVVTAEQQAQIAGARYGQVDIRDFAAVRAWCEGVEAIIHLAAIPNFHEPRSLDIFQINVGGSYHVYQAAEQLGIKRVVAASSINYLGNGFGTRWLDVQYLPIDEAHPGYATDTYAFSKQMLEQTAVYFHQRAQINSILFRFPLVYIPAWVSEEMLREVYHYAQISYDWLLAMPEAKRRQTIEQLKADFLKQRIRRTRTEISYPELFRFFKEVEGGNLMWGYENFWALMHVKDAARLLETAVCTDFSGCHPLYVADNTNCLGLPAQGLADLFYPDIELRHPVYGKQSLLHTAAAENLLEFELAYSTEGLVETAVSANVFS